MKFLSCVLAFFCAANFARADSTRDELTAAQLAETAVIARYQASDRTAADRAEVEKFAQVYEQLVKKYPRDAAVREAYGAFFWQTEKRDAAFAQWQAGEKLDPKNAGIAFHLGHAWLDLGDAKKAVRYFERASQLAPKEALYHYNLGNALFLFRHEMTDAQSPDAKAVALRALEQIRIAGEIDPLNVEFAKAYAETFYAVAKPDWNAALQAWQRYRDISGNHDLANTHLARVSLKMGRKAEARAFLDQITKPEFNGLKNRLIQQIESEKQ